MRRPDPPVSADGSTPCCSTWTACSPPPPRSTRRAGSRCSTTSCAPRAAHAGSAFRPFDDRDGLQALRGRQAARTRGAAASWRRAASRCREGTPRRRRRARSRSAGWATARTRWSRRRSRPARSRRIPGSVAWVRQLRDAGAADRRRVVEPQLRGTCCAPRGSATCSTRGWTARSIDRLGLPGKPAPDAFLRAAERLGVPPERAVVVEDAIAGVRGRPGRRVRPGGRRRPEGTATPCCRTAPTWWWRTWRADPRAAGASGVTRPGRGDCP